ncbi:lipocalin-like domain-containing protein [Ottowia thiooxydans]|uniref:lipocalin-like domain-containing protein n=1 Tax=Ottowia thiooxydans TaxID=219182 RepID=UPI0003F523A9|nr:lipocalin-like domain-containing protein [Ottowia thiooxydans]
MNDTFTPIDSAKLTTALLGTWFLREAYALGPEDQRLFEVYGQRPSGIIHYGADGRMMALITHDGRQRMSGLDRQDGSEQESAAAYKASIGYAGSYNLEGNWITHHIDVSTYPNWIGTRLRRQVFLKDDTVELLTAPQPQNGVETVIKLVWQREPIGLGLLPGQAQSINPSAA